MPKAPQDTEITLGTGRMLAIFFTFVLVCAFFFAIGFSLGRRNTGGGVGFLPSAATGSAAGVVRPSAAKNEAPPPPHDFSFYKAVGQKNADPALTPAEAKVQPVTTTSSANTANTNAATASGDTASNGTTEAATATPASGSYYVQVAAVSRQEDAESLVEALKKKQYPAFSANNASVDKFYHVQVGPYTEIKDAEAMRKRLISDGYNPIVKK
jgi:DedD protein